MVDLSEAGARLSEYRPEPTPPVAEIVRRHDRRLRRRRVTATLAGVAVVAVVAAAVALSGGSNRSQSVSTGTTSASATVPTTTGSATSAQLAAGRWSSLPAAPIAPRLDPSVVWTGQEMIVWGGASGPGGTQLHADGAAYDPHSGQWHVLPPAPLSPREGQAAVWTGSEMIVWGGDIDLSLNRFPVTNDGAAYNPATNTWRLLSPAPLSARTDVLADWTGSRLILLGGLPAVQTAANSSFSDGAVFDPARNTWQHLAAPQAPAGHRVSWSSALQTDGPMLAWSQWWISQPRGPYTSAGSGGADLFAYDESSGRWRLVPQSPGAVQRVDETLPAGRVVVVRGSFAYCPPCPGKEAPEVTTLYDPAGNTWTTTPADPLGGDDLLSAWTGQALISFDPGGVDGNIVPGDASAYDPKTGQWTLLPAAPLACGTDQPPLWTGSQALFYCPASPTGRGPAYEGLAFTPHL